MIAALYESNFSIFAMQSFILFKTTGMAEQLCEIFSFSNFTFLAASGSSGLDEPSPVGMFCSGTPVGHRTAQDIK